MFFAAIFPPAQCACNFETSAVLRLLLLLQQFCYLKHLCKLVCFLYVKANSKEICEEISFPSLFRKMLMSAFLW